MLNPIHAARRRAAYVLGWGNLWFLASNVGAEPDASADAMARLLAERGLVEIGASSVPPTQPAFAPQVRYPASDMVITALNFLDIPYRRGGNTADKGFDCSGFTRYVFATSLGLTLPRRADDQAHAPGLSAVNRADLQPGDLVFFDTLARTFSHVGIYIGAARFIHAPRPGAQVRVEDMRLAYWSRRYSGARRAVPSVPGASNAAAVTPAISHPDVGPR